MRDNICVPEMFKNIGKAEYTEFKMYRNQNSQTKNQNQNKSQNQQNNNRNSNQQNSNRNSNQSENRR